MRAYKANRVGDKVIGKDAAFPESVGVLIENPGFIPSFSGYENLKMLADIRKLIGKEDIEAVMEKVGLEKACFKKKYRTYSLGMKQKLGIAAAIMEKPDLILLDEPTNALDEESVRKLLDILREEKGRGACIVLASHDMEELTLLSDIIFIMEEGRLREA